MIRLWMEWDYGQDGLIFEDKYSALVWMTRNVPLEDFNPPFATHQDIINDGLAGYEVVTVWRP